MERLLASAAALALITVVAAAQTTVETTTTRTIAPPPPPVAESYPAGTLGGATVETRKSYQYGPDGAVTNTEQRVVRPDGSTETTRRQDWSVPPAGSRTTTTTTVR
jgi:hypothetical protein